MPDYLISSTGAENATPSESLRRQKPATTSPHSSLKETKDMITEKKVQLLAYNEQTSTSQTNEVLQAAKDASVNYVSSPKPCRKHQLPAWMKTNVQQPRKGALLSD